LDESSSRFGLLFEHDLFGKPLRTFPDHALGGSTLRTGLVVIPRGDQAGRSENCSCQTAARAFLQTDEVDVAIEEGSQRAQAINRL